MDPAERKDARISPFDAIAQIVAIIVIAKG